MAKDYLGVPGLLLICFIYYSIIFFNVKIFYLVATSAPAERIFSSAADVITYDRASLAPKTRVGKSPYFGPKDPVLRLSLQIFKSNFLD